MNNNQCMRKKLDELRNIARSYNISITGKKKQQLCDEIIDYQKISYQKKSIS